MMTDIEIAQSTPLCPIAEIAAKAGISRRCRRALWQQ